MADSYQHAYELCLTLRDGYHSGNVDPDRNASILLSFLRLSRARLEDPTPLELGVKLFAINALGELGKHAARAVPALGDALREDTNVEVRGAAAQALGKLGACMASGKYATCAVPTLVNALCKDKNVEVRCAAAQALGALGKYADLDRLPFRDVSVLTDMLDNAEAIPALTVALSRDADPLVRCDAAWALGKLGEYDAADVVSVLTAALSGDADPSVQRAAKRALDELYKHDAELEVKAPPDYFP